MEEQHFMTIKTWLEEAKAIVINTGAGMGRDSGMADYRGEGGQWGELEAATGESVFDIINPHYLIKNPAHAWTIYLKRAQEYQNITPHAGYQILLDWIARYDLDYFALTSNIDGHLQKAGFPEERVRELHGSLAYFQSTRPDISDKIWKNERPVAELLQEVAEGNFPMCPHSHVLARPNVYMFTDGTYVPTHSKAQDARFQTFLQNNVGKPLLVLELGSGIHVQTVRMKTRMLKKNYGAKIVRINPKDYKIEPPHIGVPLGALDALQQINSIL